jgi:hypothetical protein
VWNCVYLLSHACPLTLALALSHSAVPARMANYQHSLSPVLSVCLRVRCCSPSHTQYVRVVYYLRKGNILWNVRVSHPIPAWKQTNLQTLHSEQMALDPAAARKTMEELDTRALEKINKQVILNFPYYPLIAVNLDVTEKHKRKWS